MNAQELFTTMKAICAISLSWLLLLAMGTEGIVTHVRNHCTCTSISSIRIPLRRVINFEVFQISPSCDQLEYIVTLRPLGHRRCLDPTSEHVQKLYKEYLESQKSQKSQPRRRRPKRSQ